MDLQIATRTLGDATILDCSGKIILGEETALLRLQAKEALQEMPNLVINLSHVTHIDSSGIGALVSVLMSARAAHGSAKLAGLTDRVKNLFLVTRLAMIFESFDTAEGAAASFNLAAGKSAAAEWTA